MPAATGHIGQAMAESAGIAAGYFNDRHKEQSQLVKVQEQNAKLQERLRDALLRPAVGGVFGGGDKPLVTPKPTPESPFPQAADTPDKDPKGVAASDEKYLAGTKPGTVFGMRWERSGRFGDGEWMETAYGDTPLNWPIAALSFASDVGYNAKGLSNWIGSKVYGTGPVMMIDGKAYQMRKPQAPKREEPKRRNDMFGTLGFR